MTIKVMTIFGTRPEAIKMAPVVSELARHPEFSVCVTVTAQHREMLDQVLRLFAITPDYDLDIMAPGQTLYDVTSRALLGLRTCLQQERPDVVLVHGDTTTTFAGALAAFYEQIPVGHVEAGLRTGDIYSPFPEEMNRRLTGRLARYHFAPTPETKANLLRENVAEESIFVTGNTVIDALLQTVGRPFDANMLPVKLDPSRRTLLVTTHRRENLGDPMRDVYRALRRILEDVPNLELVFPVHKNPAVREVVWAELGDVPHVHLIEPLDYEPFAQLMAQSDLILTDSGGIQEEAPGLGKPVLVLRDTTERPEAVAAGTVNLVGTAEEDVYREAKRLLTDDDAYRRMANSINPYGDGKAAGRIAQALLYAYGKTAKKPPEFIANTNEL